MNRVAQIITATGFVNAVVRPVGPITAPANMTFVEVEDNISVDAGWFWNGATFTPNSPAFKILLSHQVLNLLPATVVKAIKESTAAAVVKRYEIFKITPAWTRDEGISLFNDIQAAGLMTAQQNTDAVAAWPSA